MCKTPKSDAVFSIGKAGALQSPDCQGRTDMAHGKAEKRRQEEYPQNTLRHCRRKRGEKAHEYVNDRHNTAKK
ncbi:hypothetical protein G6M70_17455 [Agrobacterium tumefaciens]|uniref:hypothetical protein n=1 Tax=Rhizobium/Agrobacterium group TaxID=227290 RepID=UPI0013A5AFF7|nr:MULTISPECIES: hypothetical protein [Rhizobium/Agrobacterium group]MDA5240688.1 hypothetical protein [Agrobacterium sp. MAFF310724]MDA5250139.1 hypothetical protein [Agrobacterium sp. MAFF210268]NSZ01874.1 hypothetical protein [Agrobacterium tumefaciens]NSZ38739.1 hypothetical protein [Agrobacterium tumefaciens]NTB23398.1 hypothetical protein [Agrobacterium tumefaciens]